MSADSWAHHGADVRAAHIVHAMRGGCAADVDVTAEKIGTVTGNHWSDGCEGNEAEMTDAA